MRGQQLAFLAGQRWRICEERVERAVCGDQLARALLADAGDTLDVVDGVSHQGQHVNDLFGGNAELRLHPFGVVPGAFVARVEHAHARGVVHELEEVFVSRHDCDRPAVGHRPHRQRPNHVVGFEADVGEHLHTQRLTRLVYERNLFGEIGGHWRTIGFVVVAHLRAERGPRQIERRGNALRVVVGDELAQHRDETVHGVRGAAVRAGQAPYRVVGAIHLVAAVDEKKGGF
jgi:hypothetical protein